MVLGNLISQYIVCHHLPKSSEQKKFNFLLFYIYLFFCAVLIFLLNINFQCSKNTNIRAWKVVGVRLVWCIWLYFGLEQEHVLWTLRSLVLEAACVEQMVTPHYQSFGVEMTFLSYNNTAPLSEVDIQKSGPVTIKGLNGCGSQLVRHNPKNGSQVWGKSAKCKQWNKKK